MGNEDFTSMLLTAASSQSFPVWTKTALRRPKQSCFFTFFFFFFFLISRVILKHLISTPLFPISSFGSSSLSISHLGTIIQDIPAPPSPFHLFHIFIVTFNPRFPASFYSCFLTLIWLYYSSHDSLNLSLPYLSQLTKHLFFAIFSPNLPLFYLDLFQLATFFPVPLFSPLAITANLYILISIVLLFAAGRSALTRETGKQTKELWDQVDLTGTLLAIWRNCYLRKSKKQKRNRWYSRTSHAWLFHVTKKSLPEIL